MVLWVVGFGLVVGFGFGGLVSFRAEFILVRTSVTMFSMGFLGVLSSSKDKIAPEILWMASWTSADVAVSLSDSSG